MGVAVPLAALREAVSRFWREGGVLRPPGPPHRSARSRHRMPAGRSP